MKILKKRKIKKNSKKLLTNRNNCDKISELPLRTTTKDLEN